MNARLAARRNDLAPARRRRASLPDLLWIALALAAAGCATTPSVHVAHGVATPIRAEAAFVSFRDAILGGDLEAGRALASTPVDRKALAALEAAASGRLVEAHGLLGEVDKPGLGALGLDGFRDELGFLSAPNMPRAKRPRGDGGKAAAIDRARVPDKPQTMALNWSIGGMAKVPVTIGGRASSLGLDTGAGVTLLLVDSWESIAFAPVDHEGASVADASGGSVRAKFGLVDLAIGDIVIEDHLCAIALRSEAAAALRALFALAGVDGVLGWNAIRHLRTEIDNGAGRLSFMKGAPPVAKPNLVWLGRPIVRSVLPDGRTTNMFLDSGASSTSITPAMLALIDLGEGSVATSTVVGAAGASAAEVTTFRGIRMHAGGASLEISPVRMRAQAAKSTFRLHGTIGSDLIRQGTVVIDAPSGLFEYR